MQLTTQEVRLHGTAICRGIAIGKPFFFSKESSQAIEYSITSKNVEDEIFRYRKALQNSIDEVLQLKLQLIKEQAIDAVSILDAHLHIMQDPLLTTDVESEISKQRKNAEYVFRILIGQYQKRFTSLTNPFFRERFKDVEDISRRILYYLQGESTRPLENVPANSIVFAKELAASDAAEAKNGFVNAFITELGGVTSHAAIVAKAKGIPYVANINFDQLKELLHKNSNTNSEEIQNIDHIVIVDGKQGDIIINPSEATLQKYKAIQQQFQLRYQILQEISHLPSQTSDGLGVSLKANIELAQEVDLLLQYGGEGIGLFRSENLILAHRHFPTEEEQYHAYSSMIKKVKDLPVVIRAFDIGGDKVPSFHGYVKEKNPFLGCRSLRFLLNERNLFMTQLRAILRASAEGNTSILFPMVGSISELRAAKQCLEDAKKQLIRDKTPVGDLKIGIMIEVPSAAIIVDLLSQECDFISIGTNDLVQYCLAVDRGNQEMHKWYTPTHPSIIRLIKQVVVAAKKNNIPVTVCGEIAADPLYTALLIGLGVNELSVAVRSLPIIKNAIRSIKGSTAKKLAKRCLELPTADDILQTLSAAYQEQHPDNLF